MTNKNLPKDIQKYIAKKIVKCVASFVTLEIIAIVITFVSWEYFSSKANAVFHYCVIVAICAIPFFVAGFPRRIIDRAWRGIVTDVQIKTETGSYSVGGGHAYPYTKNVIYLRVKKDNGKESYVAIREFGIRSHKGFPVPNEGDVTKHLNEYSVGDVVYHFYGLKEYYVVRQNSDIIDCVICGAKNKSNLGLCDNCGHSLYKP